jgi:hypothetical protein
MGLAFEYRATGYGALETSLHEAVRRVDARRNEEAL